MFSFVFYSIIQLNHHFLAPWFRPYDIAAENDFMHVPLKCLCSCAKLNIRVPLVSCTQVSFVCVPTAICVRFLIFKSNKSGQNFCMRFYNVYMQKNTQVTGDYKPNVERNENNLTYLSQVHTSRHDLVVIIIFYMMILLF